MATNKSSPTQDPVGAGNLTQEEGSKPSDQNSDAVTGYGKPAAGTLSDLKEQKTDEELEEGIVADPEGARRHINTDAA